MLVSRAVIATTVRLTVTITVVVIVSATTPMAVILRLGLDMAIGEQRVPLFVASSEAGRYVTVAIHVAVHGRIEIGIPTVFTVPEIRIRIGHRTITFQGARSQMWQDCAHLVVLRSSHPTREIK